MHNKGYWFGQGPLRLGCARRSAIHGLVAVALTMGAADPAMSAEKRFGLTSFDRVELLTDAIVEISAQSPVAAMATGSQDALDRLIIEGRDGRLTISSRKFAGDERRAPSGEPLRILLHTPKLRDVLVVGSGVVRAQTLRGQQMQVAVRGAGQLEVLDIQGDRLTAQLLGNGRMKLAGAVKQGQMQMSGANQVEAEGLRFDEISVESEGIGDHRIHAVKRAAVTARGMGRVQILGRPACTVRNMGSGTILCGPDAR